MGMEQREQVKCDVCGIQTILSKEVARTWVSQIFLLEREFPPAQVTTAEVHCPICAQSFNQNIVFLSLSSQGVDVN